MNPPDPADMAYPTSEALRACRLTPARWARAQAIRDKPHQTEELICALVNTLNEALPLLNEALAYLDRHRGAGDRVDALIDSLEKFLKARADVRDDDGSDPTV